ncbi:ATP-dependent DNA helicase MER3 [Dimargaris cristalligena]|nr:ATP-dependent DNA helicase MER3 [Dimargaris cristalligena]
MSHSHTGSDDSELDYIEALCFEANEISDPSTITQPIPAVGNLPSKPNYQLVSVSPNRRLLTSGANSTGLVRFGSSPSGSVVHSIDLTGESDFGSQHLISTESTSYQNNSGLRPVEDIEPRFRILFGFRYFNSVQTDCFDQLLHGSNNVVISAPTGAGKTCLLELALIQLFRNPSHDFKAIYLAPTKIDEVHMLREKRGATLEAVISRMRVVEPTIRYLAVSATVPNISDIAAWLSYNCPNESATNGSDASKPAIIKNFGEEYRPVKLVRHVYGVEMRTDNYFLFERNLDYNTRKSAQQATEFLSKTFPRLPNLEHLSIKHKQLKELVVTGVAFHHAGLDLSDRRLVENLFIEGMVKIISYINSRYVEYSDLEILQMIGRAGRPQFDTSGVAVILTTVDQKSRYDNLVSGQEPITSKRLPLSLKSTFLYTRICNNPSYYKIADQETTSTTPRKYLEGG